MERIQNKIHPARNPKYRYEWALQDGDHIVCNLWYANLDDTDPSGVVEQHLHLPYTLKNEKTPTVRITRRRRMNNILRHAYRNGLTVRVIILDGRQRGEAPNATTKIEARDLDPRVWSVTVFSEQSGDVTLRRGHWAHDYADQFSPGIPQAGDKASRQTTVTIINRDEDAREYVLYRAGGMCEHCRRHGFVRRDGKMYLETHHVIPISADGADSIGNVIALCANCHREGHHGVRAPELAKTFTHIVRTANSLK